MLLAEFCHGSSKLLRNTVRNTFHLGLGGFLLCTKWPIAGSPNHTPPYPKPPELLTGFSAPPGTFSCGSMPITSGAQASSSRLHAQTATRQLCAGTLPPASPTEWLAVRGGRKSRPGLHR